MKSPVADEKQFCEAYETIINSLPEFAKLAAEYKEGKDESGNFR